MGLQTTLSRDLGAKRVFVQAKNLYVSSSEEIRDKEVSVDIESSSTETADSDMIHEIKDEWKRARLAEGLVVKGMTSPC